LKFTPNTPFVSKTPTVVVDAGLKPGSYRFRLEVEDESGNKSRPDEQVVVVERSVLDPTKQTDKTPVPEKNGVEDSRPPKKSGLDKAKKPGRVLKTKAGVAGKKVGEENEPR
jgi:hypothetical protein